MLGYVLDAVVLAAPDMHKAIRGERSCRAVGRGQIDDLALDGGWDV
ncbi:hypothetical protein SDC9_165302 [bioreactor metagenome]|uniref:Uncharacterized protein n=1 Tax=bioreactor metagenome TaxID=1076179 RepID=A0A645G1D2_9ZZZZ